MKKLILSAFFLLLNWLYCYAQESCKDIIYTSDDENIIFDCCILEVRDGNIVLFIKEGDTLSITSSRIIKDGISLDLKKKPREHNPNITFLDDNILYDGYDYEYYALKAVKAFNMKRAGIFLFSVGIATQVCGIFFIAKKDATKQDKSIGTGLAIGGLVMEIVGLPIMISGAVKESKSYKAMKSINGAKSLTFGPNSSGIGLTFKF